MPSFFTVPSSQRKRKHDDTAAVPSLKRRNQSSNKSQKPKRSKPDRDESISESESEDGRGRRNLMDEEGEKASSESEDEDETGAERRLRLAERYLEKVKGQVEEDGGFDAEEIDRDLIAERLQEDVVCCDRIFPGISKNSKI